MLVIVVEKHAKKAISVFYISVEFDLGLLLCGCCVRRKIVILAIDNDVMSQAAYGDGLQTMKIRHDFIFYNKVFFFLK